MRRFATPDLSTPVIPKIRDLQECTESHLNQCSFLNIISKIRAFITKLRMEALIRLAISSKIYMNSSFCVLREEILISRNANMNVRIRHTILV